MEYLPTALSHEEPFENVIDFQRAAGHYSEGGPLPAYLLTRQFDETPDTFDPYSVDDYSRRELIDQRADPPLFESDFARDTRRHSAMQIALRSAGSKSGADPAAHPEMCIGMNLDQDVRRPGATQFDPWLMNRQIAARAKYLKPDVRTSDPRAHLMEGDPGDMEPESLRWRRLNEMRSRARNFHMFGRSIENTRVMRGATIPRDPLCVARELDADSEDANPTRALETRSRELNARTFASAPIVSSCAAQAMRVAVASLSVPEMDGSDDIGDSARSGPARVTVSASTARESSRRMGTFVAQHGAEIARPVDFADHANTSTSRMAMQMARVAQFAQSAGDITVAVRDGVARSANGRRALDDEARRTGASYFASRQSTDGAQPEQSDMRRRAKWTRPVMNRADGLLVTDADVPDDAHAMGMPRGTHAVPRRQARQVGVSDASTSSFDTLHDARARRGMGMPTETSAVSLFVAKTGGEMDAREEFAYREGFAGSAEFARGATLLAMRNATARGGSVCTAQRETEHDIADAPSFGPANVAHLSRANPAQHSQIIRANASSGEIMRTAVEGVRGSGGAASISRAGPSREMMRAGGDTVARKNEA